MLKRFYTAVVHRRRAVLAAFVLAAVLSVFASRAVQVDYDINDYLPPDSPSTLALEQMNSAFTGGIPNMRVMVRDVTVPEALDYKEKLAAIDGVEAKVNLETKTATLTLSKDVSDDVLRGAVTEAGYEVVSIQ